MKLKYKCRECHEEKTKAGFCSGYFIECRQCVKRKAKFYNFILGVYIMKYTN